MKAYDVDVVNELQSAGVSSPVLIASTLEDEGFARVGLSALVADLPRRREEHLAHALLSRVRQGSPGRSVN